MLISRATCFLLLFGLLAACGDEAPIELPRILSTGDEVKAAHATELDSLAANGAHVSISGTVIEQRDRELLVDDGTGLILVELPETPPLLTHQRLLASGRLSDDDGTPRLHATEWLYDSTAVPVHSD